MSTTTNIEIRDFLTGTVAATAVAGDHIQSGGRSSHFLVRQVDLRPGAGLQVGHPYQIRAAGMKDSKTVIFSGQEDLHAGPQFSFFEPESGAGTTLGLEAAAAATVGTELEQVIYVPWFDLSYGAGVDAITGGTSGSAVKPFTVTRTTTKSSHESYKRVENNNDMNREVEASASGKYNYQGIEISASTSYLQSIKYSETSITLIAEYTEAYEPWDECPSYELTDQAKELMANDPEKFRKAYGDYFVAGGQRESRFMGVYRCTSKTASQMEEFKASAGVSSPNLFSTEGAARFKEASAKYNVDISVDVWMYGHKDTSPISAPWNPDKVIEALTWFKGHTEGRNLRAKLKHYSTIEPTYSRQISVSPAIFSSLTQLYSEVWDIRANYNSVGGHYQQQLASELKAVNADISAYQGVLPTDDQARETVQGKVTVLQSKLNDIMARQRFYFYVLSQASKEPSKDAEIHETASSQQSWMYGVSSWTKSGAVTIFSESFRYSESWHIGHREKTFEFGPNGSRLIVGWNVIANWTDGTCGSWWKSKNGTILLTDFASVHVKSKYDRGTDWTLRIFYVNAAEYPFGGA